MFVGWEGRRPLLVPADRLLLRQELRRRRRQESVHRQPHRRLRLHPRHLPDLQHLRHAPTTRKVFALASAQSARVRRRRHGDLPAALRRRVRQVGADPALRLAARRDGRPDAGLRAHPRRDDGHRRRLHGRPLERRSSASRRRRWVSWRSIGAATAIFAATIGLAQNDIKKVLAYSTVSQLGYMFLAGRRRRVHRGDLPRHDARVLQGLPLPRRRLGHSRLRRRAGHAQDGRPAKYMPRTHMDDARSPASRSPASRRSPASSRRTRSSPARSSTTRGALARRRRSPPASRRSTCSASTS